ncbi:tyrosine recombinase [Sphingobium phage Lacusarx]|uniref:Integrase n=1 Tax=Sphingobium phage Lacusarx TaxID=1980139 RepID=A0A1W6DWU1_9CAUD|nr:tyrosine recombinase [Sphingobium phage Lacusarx]ARK07480.1 tyrosine recombinase [Sphingobium phage Lacusarx]
MTIKRAKTLDTDQLNGLLAYVEANSRMPERDRLFVLLSYKAGLRAAEITKIDINAMTDAEGRIAKVVNIFSNVGKKGRERQIPMHPEIRDALKAFRKKYPHLNYIAVSSVDGQRMNVNAVTVYIWRLYKAAGYEDCSSHSGRRTFITNLAQRANQFHSSLRDVQLLAGHARLDTTERYIAPSFDTASMVASL